MEAETRFSSGSEALQWRRLKRLKLEGARLDYLTRITPIDRVLEHTLLLLVPRSISPNEITAFRFVAVPVVLVLLLLGYTPAATLLFCIAALSDALDGARARTEHRITKWGIIADPIADKLLIGTVALITVLKFLGWPFTVAMISVELVLAGSAYFRYSGKLFPAKTVGKLKMLLQCIGVGLILLYSVLLLPPLLTIGTYVLYAALLFGLASLLVYRSI